MKYQFSICNELSIYSHYQQIQTRIVESSKMFWRCGASIPVPLACKASALPFELHSRNDFASIYLLNTIHEISVSICNEVSFFLIISKWKKLSNPQKCAGDAGHRSPYLSHAQRALYHLRYIPVLFKLRASFWTQFMKYVSICNEVSISPHNQQTKNNCRILKNVLEMRGIDPRTSRMLSERSTIWAISPYSSSFELASEHNSWKTGFRFVTSCQFLPIINKYRWELSNPQKCFGDAGHRSPYLSHAKRALYHLSYIPVMISLRSSFWTQFMKYQFPLVTRCQFLLIISK